MKSTMNLKKSIFVLDGHRGTYIPQEFAEIMVNERHLHSYEFTNDCNVLQQILAELIEGKDSENYYENWNNLLMHYYEIRRNSTNDIYLLTQDEDGDLWLIHEDELEEWNEYTF